MKSYLESQITWNLYQDSESRTLFYFVTDPSNQINHHETKLFADDQRDNCITNHDPRKP